MSGEQPFVRTDLTTTVTFSQDSIADLVDLLQACESGESVSFSPSSQAFAKMLRGRIEAALRETAGLG